MKNKILLTISISQCSQKGVDNRVRETSYPSEKYVVNIIMNKLSDHEQLVGDYELLGIIRNYRNIIWELSQRNPTEFSRQLSLITS